MKKRIWKIAGAVLVVLIAAAVAVGLAARNTDIPKLYFEGNIADMYDKQDLRKISVRYENGEDSFSGFAELKIQGTSSIWYDKKNYTIKFYADEGHEEKLKVDVGWGEQNKYCLKANWVDKTHARNVVTAKLTTQVQQRYGVLPQAPRNGLIDGFPVEIYSNGEFLGLYTFNIPKGDWQFGMDKENPDHIVLCGETWEDVCLFHGMPDFENWSVEVGEPSEETLEKANALFDFVMNSSDEEFASRFEEYIDLDAALNYYILVDFAYLKDNLAKNMLLVTYDGKKWYPSLYDLDTSWGTEWNGLSILDYENEPVGLERSTLLKRIGETFPEELALRYFELRQDLLTKEHVMSLFHSFRDQIPEILFWEEVFRWGSGVFHTPSDIPGYGYDQIEAYLDFIEDDLDQKYNAMLQQ